MFRAPAPRIACLVLFFCSHQVNAFWEQPEGLLFTRSKPQLIALPTRCCNCANKPGASRHCRELLKTRPPEHPKQLRTNSRGLWLCSLGWPPLSLSLGAL